jgi:hypothetical protein
MRNEQGFRLEINYDAAMMNDAMQAQLEKMVRELGKKLQLKCVLLANPEVLDVQFDEWTPGGWKPVAQPKEDDDAGA